MVRLKNLRATFRLHQAVHDLRHLAQSARSDVLARMVAGVATPGALDGLKKLIYQDGCRIFDVASASLHSPLLMAATLPDDDPEAFHVATAILLADRLQNGLGEDDLFWHWDAFHNRYGSSDPSVRSAIMHGYRQAHDAGRVSLYDPPHGQSLVTHSLGQVIDRARPGLAGEDPQPLSAEAADHLSRSLLEGDDGSDLARFWEARGAELLEMPRASIAAVLTGVRHVYEARLDWAPFGGRQFSAEDGLPPLIPIL